MTTTVTNDKKSLEVQLSKYMNNAERVFVLCDEHTYANCFPLIEGFLDPSRAGLIVLPPGEETKEVNSLSAIWENMLEDQASRNSLLINLGGGMICDLGGMAAATFKRGIPFIHVPTSLLAMVDAAFGGKTGINVAGQKNQAGTFTLAEATLVYKDFLQTLPVREKVNGIAEMLKHGVMLSKSHWERVKSLNPSDPEPDAELIEASIQLKLSITTSDFRESGERALLNFGHTVGHAIEAWKNEQGERILHGEAVAAGMIIEILLARQKNMMSKAEQQEVIDVIDYFFPRLEIANEAIEELVELMRADKKSYNETVFMALPASIGSGRAGIECSEEAIRTAIKNYKTN